MYFGNPSPLKFGRFAHVDAEVFADSALDVGHFTEKEMNENTGI